MNNNLTILVNSCDKYEDAWDPFFRLLDIQWPNHSQFDIVLNTETKVYDCPYYKVHTVNSGGGIPWAKRLKNVLSQINTDFILYFLEDFFLMSPVNDESFCKAFDLIQRDSSIGYIGLKNNPSHIFKNPHVTSSDAPFISKDDLVKANRVNSMSALWRRSWLLSLIREHETPWEFEKYASIRSLRTPEKVLIINNQVLPPVFDYHIDIQYGYGISMSSWLPKNKELFEKYGINVNFENLGWYEEKTKTTPVVSNNLTGFKWVKEKLYFLKWLMRQFRKKTVKLYRRFLSLR